jgi:A/G-specific adenine glycosylase
MQKAAQILVEKYHGQFPKNFSDVLALPGIGRYTAGAICSIAFDQPTPILDGNVIRVLTRVFGIQENAKGKETNTRLWQIAEHLVRAVVTERPSGTGCPQPAANLFWRTLRVGGSRSALNQSLMELGALICTPREPRCSVCPITKLCSARKRGLVNEIPNLGERAPATRRRFLACVIEREGLVLVRQRPEAVVNAHLWEFPNVEVPTCLPAPRRRARIEAELGCALESMAPLTTVKHAITRYRVTLEAMRGELNGASPCTTAGKWIPLGKLEKLAFTSAHRRVLNVMLNS